MPNLNSKSREGREALTECTEAIARDLNDLRRLARQLNRMAATADDQVLRTILGKREALLNSIRANLTAAQAVRENDAPPPADADMAEGRSFGDVIAEIAAMDRDSAQRLQDRSDQVAADIAKLRAGKKWRESCQR